VRKVDPQKHDERRREILDSAGRCFARDGFRGASISDICEEAGISPGHLYHYFENKEAIVRAMTEVAVAEADMQLELLSPEADPITTLVSRVESARAKQRNSTHLLLFDMLAEAGHDPSIAKLLRDSNRALRSRLAAFLRKGQDGGHVDRGLDPDLAASVLISAVDGAKSMAIRDPKLSKEGTSEHLKTLITRFLKPAHD
jgi:TetR/AcrR family transcriptional regulator, repressor for uid operon